jgi:hypothetical protein
MTSFLEGSRIFTGLLSNLASVRHGCRDCEILSAGRHLPVFHMKGGRRLGCCYGRSSCVSCMETSRVDVAVVAYEAGLWRVSS